MFPSKILLWGSGSQGKIIHEMIKENSLGIVTAIFDPTESESKIKSNAKIYLSIDEIEQEISKISYFSIGIGGEHGFARQTTSQYLERLGIKPLTIIHKTSFIDPSAIIGKGCLIMPRAIVHKFSIIERNTVINTNACIDHECEIGKGVHIMGCAAIAGRVKIHDFATIGTNATVLPDIVIGEGAYIGAGAVVTKNIPAYSIAVGVPAKVLRKNEIRQPIGINTV